MRKIRVYNFESCEMLIANDYEELSELFMALNADDSLYSEPMQSTGLYDKNGKEIFESDILKCTSIDCCLWYETVSWDSTIAGFATHQNGYDATPIEYITDSKAITIEIIGNIYENPELLEVE